MVGRRALSVALGFSVVFLLASGHLYIVRSQSMRPTFSAGDAIVAWPVDGMPRVGDVISFNVSSDRVVTHRVVSVVDGVIRTKGDANRGADPWEVDVAQIRGRLVARVPLLGWALAFIHRPVGLLLSVLVPAIGIVVIEGRRAITRFVASTTGRRRCDDPTDASP